MQMGQMGMPMYQIDPYGGMMGAPSMMGGPQMMGYPPMMGGQPMMGCPQMMGGAQMGPQMMGNPMMGMPMDPYGGMYGNAEIMMINPDGTIQTINSRPMHQPPSAQPRVQQPGQAPKGHPGNLRGKGP